MGPMPKMVIDENIKTVIVNGNLNRNGPDWVHVVLLEEEMITLNPPEVILRAKVQLRMSPVSAKNLADSILKQLQGMGIKFENKDQAQKEKGKDKDKSYQ
jgi:hypothetical protein